MEKEPTTLLTTLVQVLYNRSDRSSRPVTHDMPKTTGQTSPSDRSNRSTQNRGAAHSARKCATRQLPSLLVSIHHFTPLCITVDKFDTTGAEIDVRVP